MFHYLNVTTDPLNHKSQRDQPTARSFAGAGQLKFEAAKAATARSSTLVTAAVTVLIATVALPNPSAAQLATSPGAVQPDATAIPPVTVTPPASATAAPLRRPQSNAASEPAAAPRAPQQTSSPRSASRRPATPAQSPGDETAKPSEPADSTIVSATGLAQPVARTASSVSVVTADEIAARQTRNAPELLNALPGINVVQSGSAGALTSVFTRGTNSNHTKVFIDGIDVTDPVSGNRTFDFGLLTTFDIARLEVLRGPQSGLYGADALGGVIVIYTKDGEGPLQLDALAEAGSFGTINQAVSARGSTGAVRYAFNVSHSEVNGPPIVPDRLLAPGFQALDSRYENWTFSSKLGFDITPDIAFNFAARYADTDFGFQSSQFNRSLTTSRNDQLSTRAETVLRQFGGRLTTIAGINYTGTDTDTTAANGDVTASGTGTRVKGDVRTIAEVTPSLTVTAGADWQNERLTQPSTAFAPGLAVEEANVGGYLQAQLEPVRNLFLVGNIRYDDNENFGNVTTWRIAPAAVIDSSGTTFRASFGTAYKAPSLTQRFQDFPDPFFPFIANRDLRPEESTGMDVGFEQALFDGRARTGLTYFRNSITDLIEFVFDPTLGPFGGGTVDNIGKARTSGIEVFAAYDVTDTLRLRADYTYTEAINVETRQDLLRRPRDKASLTVGWQPVAPLLLTTTIVFVGERFDIDRVTFDRVRQSSFTTVNVAADYKVNEHVSLIGRVDNLLDKDYEDPNGFQRPGLGAYAGIKLRN